MLLSQRTCRASFATVQRQCIAAKMIKHAEMVVIYASMVYPYSGENCPFGRRSCADKSMCVHSVWWCDGEFDCPDNSDEMPGCGTYGLNVHSESSNATYKCTGLTHQSVPYIIYPIRLCRDRLTYGIVPR